MKRKTLIDVTKQLVCAAAIMIAMVYAMSHETVSAEQVRAVMYVHAVVR